MSRLSCRTERACSGNPAQVVGEGAARTPGKRSLAMEGFAAALRAIPATICDNAGAGAALPVLTLCIVPRRLHACLCKLNGQLPRHATPVACSLLALQGQWHVDPGYSSSFSGSRTVCSIVLVECLPT